jgi:hypothetical protein
VNTEKIGVALWSSGPTRTVDELERSLQTAAAIGFRGVQPWSVEASPRTGRAFLEEQLRAGHGR